MVYAQDNAASVRGVALRVTRLGVDGTPLTGTPADVYYSPGFINLTFTPEYSEGDEVEVKNAAGEICVYWKQPDSLKNVGVGLELCDPDPVLTQMLVGGDVLTAAASSPLAPTGTPADVAAAVGYAAAEVGGAADSNGVAIEVWTAAVVGGRMAARAPYWHYVFPYVTFRLDGDRVVENGNLATVFAGTGSGNAAFGGGPNTDISDISPAPPANKWRWAWPAVSGRPYMYARSNAAPIGLRGAFDNLGLPPTAITQVNGSAATLTPVDANRPANLTVLTGMGALGNTTKWVSGSYVALADGSEAYWDGNSWEVGRAPATVITATGATAGTPGYYTPAGAANPANLAGLSGVTATPTAKWATGQYVNLADGGRAHWSGTAWATGVAT